MGIAALHPSCERDIPDDYRYIDFKLMDLHKDAVKPFLTTWASSANLIVFQVLTNRVETVNRQKKLQQLFKAKAKKASAKLAPKKPKYINKADRLKLAIEAAEVSITSCES